MTEPTLEKPKKSVWDVIDSLLPSATAVYGRIREQKTGVNPFQSPDSGDEQEDLRYPTGVPEGFSDEPDTKKGKTLWYVIGGVALIGLGVGTYFLIKKNKNA
jgi:hypothetical protein